MTPEYPEISFLSEAFSELFSKRLLQVAMLAFVGYIVQANGIYFPWKVTYDMTFADVAAAGSPPDQWDALPTTAKCQFILFIGFLESAGRTPS